jgi:putative transposase
MRTNKFTEEQIVTALRQPKPARRWRTSAARWKRSGDHRDTVLSVNKYFGLGVSELRELKLLREESRKLKGLVADLTLRSRSTSKSCGRASQKNSEAGSQTCLGALGGQSVPRVRTARVPRDDGRALHDGIQGLPAQSGAPACAAARAGRRARELWLSPPARAAQARRVEGEP